MDSTGALAVRIDEPVASTAAGLTFVVSSAGIACVAITSSDKAESIAGGACGDSERVCASDVRWSTEDDSVSPLAKRLWTCRTAHCLFDGNRGAL